jgi:hypothetical protein
MAKDSHGFSSSKTNYDVGIREAQGVENGGGGVGNNDDGLNMKQILMK